MLFQLFILLLREGVKKVTSRSVKSWADWGGGGRTSKAIFFCGLKKNSCFLSLFDMHIKRSRIVLNMKQVQMNIFRKFFFIKIHIFPFQNILNFCTFLKKTLLLVLTGGWPNPSRLRTGPLLFLRLPFSL